MSLVILLTNFMEQTSSCEAASLAAFYDTKGSQELSTGPYPEPDQSSQHCPILYL
jgi:hypothetical protein